MFSGILVFSTFQASGFLFADSYNPKKRRRVGKISSATLPAQIEMEKLLAELDNKHDSWSASTAVCSWMGVICDAEEVVIKIEGHNLSGVLVWKYLPWTLRILLVNAEHPYRHQLRGSVDTTTLPPKLSELWLHDNVLDGPLNLSHLPQSISLLNASANRFSGTLALEALPPLLLMLQLSRNNFHGSVDLRTLPDTLTLLLLDGNDLSSCPELTSLPRGMTKLSLAQNRFSGVLDLRKLPRNLRSLHLLGNNIDEYVEGFIPSTVIV